MKLYRYMSIEELMKMMSGEEMINNSDFSNNRTNSVGFCFLGEKTVIECDEDGRIQEYIFSPLDCYSFLNGIVNPEVLVEFDSANCINEISEGYGEYGNPFNDDWDSRISITEYSLMSYNKSTLIPQRVVLLPEIKDKFDYEVQVEKEEKDELKAFRDIVAKEFPVEEYRRDYMWYKCSNLPDAIERLMENRRILKELIKEEKMIVEAEQRLIKKNRRKYDDFDR